MKIKLFTGATAYEAAINTIKQIEPQDLGVQNIVVVPDSFSMQAESLIFDVLNIKSTLNIEVVGISRLASKILRNQNIPFQRISALEEVFNIYKAVSQCEDKFVYFNKCGVDFCIKILQIIKQFKSCKIKPAQIKGVGDDLLDKKMSDLRLIYEAYESLLEEKLDLSKLLDFFVENAQKCIDLSNTRLFFVNFDSFSIEINSFICKLAGYVKDINIGFARPISIGGNSFIYENDILEKTTKYAKEYGVNIEVENFSTNLKNEQLVMAKNLFSLNVKEGKSDFFVNIVAKNKKDEIEYVAKYIKNAIVNGKKFKDFAIAVPDANYFDDIKTIFSDFGIISYCDEAVDLTQTILGQFLLKIIKMSKLGLKKEDFQFLASSTLVNNENNSDVLSKIDYYNIEDVDEFVERFPKFNFIINQIKNIKSCKELREYITILQDLLNFVENSYQDILLKLQEESYFKKESENAQSKELIEKVLEKLREMGGEEAFNIVNFEKLFTLSLASVKVETIPSYIDAVYVGDATNSYFEDVRTLFVLGATANNLPKTQSDIGIIDDEDIKKLKLEFALEPEMKVLNRRSRLKIFEMLQHAKEKLVVCTPMSEDDKVSQKANFVLDLQKMFGNNIIHTNSLEDFELSILADEECLDKLNFYIGNMQNLPTYFAKLKSENKLPKKWIGTISGLIEKNIVDDKEKLALVNMESQTKKTVSATELETYFACPFRRFVSYVLKIRQNENVEPNKRMFGTFEHELLKNFIEEFNMDVSNVTEKQIESFLKEQVEKIAQKTYDEKVLSKKYFLKFLYNESKIILKNVVFEQKNSQFKPILLEEKIFEKMFKDVNLIGFIDRVDKAKNYFRIIDYKTGKTENIKKDLYYGKKLQLFLYADSIKDKLKLDCAGLYYFDCRTKYLKKNQNVTLFNGLTLKDNDIVGMVDDRLWQDNFRSDLIGMSRKKNVKENEFAFKNGNAVDNFDTMFEYSRKVSEQSIEEISENYIEAKPIKDECQFCPYLAVCKHTDNDGYRVMQTIKDEDLKRKN